MIETYVVTFSLLPTRNLAYPIEMNDATDSHSILFPYNVMNRLGQVWLQVNESVQTNDKLYMNMNRYE